MGVTREVLREGKGRPPKHAECCVVHYVGTFRTNGREFDNSRTKGKPLTFLVGIGQGERVHARGGWLENPLGSRDTLCVIVAKIVRGSSRRVHAHSRVA